MPPSITMDETARDKINEHLTLPLLKNKSPFALSEKEHLFTADDWAWLFLRLNNKYRAAHHKMKETTSAAQSSMEALRKTANPLDAARFRLHREQSNLIGIEKGKSETFGLSDWICPETRLLNELSLANGLSWFYPLMRTLCNGYSSNSGNTKRIGLNPFSREVIVSSLLAEETQFGFKSYSNHSRSLIRTPTLRPENNLIEALVNCSIPPAGQLASLFQLARITRATAMNIGKLQSYRVISPVKVMEINECPWISRVVQNSSHKLRAHFQENTSVWRAIEIDSRNPLAGLHRNMLKNLNEEFKEITKNHPSAFKLRERFDCLKGAFNDKAIVSEFGECRLKVLLIVAELLELNYSKKDIIIFLHSNYSASSYNRKWLNLLSDNIDAYADEASELIEVGYRWLVHSQRPNKIDLKKSYQKNEKTPKSEQILRR